MLFSEKDFLKLYLDWMKNMGGYKSFDEKLQWLVDSGT